MRRWTIWILLVLVLTGLALRLFKLDSVPPGISHDELEFVNNGYSLVKTGRDLYSKPFPLSVGNNGHVALPAYFSGVTSFFFGLNIASVRILPALMGTIEILLMFGITLILFRKANTALWAAGFFSLSVWSWKMSRVMFDPSLALFLFLSGMFVFLSGKKTYTRVLGIGFLSLGFLSYYGTLFFFLPTVMTLIWYRWPQIGRRKNFWIPVMLIGILTAGIYLLSVTGGQINRTRELIFNMPKISAEVVFNSWTSNAPAWTNRIFVNKATVIFHTFLRNYVGAFSPVMMFVDGDPNRIYGLWDRGELELYLLPLIIIGSLVIYTGYPRQWKLIVMLLLVSPLTAGLSSPVYATRAFLMWPCLIWLAAAGVQRVWVSHRLIRIGLAVIMIYPATGLMHQYFYRYPVYAAEMWFDSEHQLAEYLMNHNGEADIFGPENRQYFMEYFFYSQGNPVRAQSALTENNPDGTIEYEAVKFIPGCPQTTASRRVQIVHFSCNPGFEAFSPLVVARDRSNRIIWYNSKEERRQ